MSPSFELEAPDHFTAGAVGPPGERVFYVQGREQRALVTLRCEKEMVRGLATYLQALLARLPKTAEAPPAEMALLEPVEAAWAVGAIGVGWDEARDRVVVELREFREEAEEGAAAEAEPEPATARVRITRAQAVAFVERAEGLMKAGRPVCRVCGRPKDPGGHVCPGGNGHAVR